MKARITTLVVTVALALVSVSVAQAGALTLWQSGSPGPWLGSGAYAGLTDVSCYGPDRFSPTHPRSVWVYPQRIGRSPDRSTLFQEISMQVRLEWSSDGYRWFTYQTRPVQRASVRLGYDVNFGGQYFDVTPYRGLFWRPRLEFRWYAGSTWLGSVTNGFTPDGFQRVYGGDTVTLLSTGEGVCYLP